MFPRRVFGTRRRLGDSLVSIFANPLWNLNRRFAQNGPSRAVFLASDDFIHAIKFLAGQLDAIQHQQPQVPRHFGSPRSDRMVASMGWANWNVFVFFRCLKKKKKFGSLVGPICVKLECRKPRSSLVYSNQFIGDDHSMGSSFAVSTRYHAGGCFHHVGCKC